MRNKLNSMIAATNFRLLILFSLQITIISLGSFNGVLAQHNENGPESFESGNPPHVPGTLKNPYKGQADFHHDSPTPGLRQRVKREVEQLLTIALHSELETFRKLLKDELLEAFSERSAQIIGLEEKVKTLRSQVNVQKRQILKKDAIIARQEKDINQLQNEIHSSNMAWLNNSCLNTNPKTPLHSAAVCNDKIVSLTRIKFLIENGADASAKDKDDYTFLHRLVDDGTSLTPNQFQDMAVFLVSKNLSRLFNTPSEFSKDITNNPRHPYSCRWTTPFHMAVKNLEINTETLTLLQQNGVDFNAVNKAREDSVLLYALMGKRSVQFLASLVDLGANPRHKNINNSTLINWAVTFGNVEQLKFFLSLGSDVNALNEWNNAALHFAAYYSTQNSLERIQTLIKNGADVNLRNIMGQTPLDLALGRNDMDDREKVIQLLKDNA